MIKFLKSIICWLIAHRLNDASVHYVGCTRCGRHLSLDKGWTWAQ